MLEMLSKKDSKTELQLGFRFSTVSSSLLKVEDFGLGFDDMVWCIIRKPAVIMIVGVNGGGKTTSLGKPNWTLVSVEWLGFVLGIAGEII